MMESLPDSLHIYNSIGKIKEGVSMEIIDYIMQKYGIVPQEKLTANKNIRQENVVMMEGKQQKNGRKTEK